LEGGREGDDYNFFAKFRSKNGLRKKNSLIIPNLQDNYSHTMKSEREGASTAFIKNLEERKSAVVSSSTHKYPEGWINSGGENLS